MRIYVLIFSVATLVIATTTPPTSGSRQERSIRDWFSGMMKRFQRRGSRRPSYYLQRQTYQPYHPPTPSYGSSHSAFPTSQYEPQTSSYLHEDIHSHGVDVGHQSGFAAGGQGGQYGGGQVGYQSGGGSDHAVHGFGPLKGSDVIEYGGGSGASLNIGGSGAGYLPPSDGYVGGNDIHARVVPSTSLDGAYEPPVVAQQDIYVPPLQPSTPLGSDYSVTGQVLQGSGKSSAGFVASQSYDSPSNSILPTSPQYIIPQSQLPLESERAGDVPVDLNYAPSQPPTQYTSESNPQPARVIQPGYFFPQRGGSSDLVVSGKSGESLFAPHLGPDDPIIEIVFQDGEPAAPHPPPVIDESYFAPASDDVEVYFIEYSPEDNLDDLKNLDLTHAQPAILQNLPNELPYELRNHLLQSGVLENAQIEIIDLDKALNDPSLNLDTRNALRQAYSRTNRETSSNEIVRKGPKQAVDIRVKRLNHDRKSPEGVVEFLSGLRPFRKGTFAGTVDVNDKSTDKYLPVTVDGDKLPLPDNLPLENKKVNGVLVLAPEKKLRREAKSTFAGVNKRIQTSSSTRHQSKVQTPTRRLLDIAWADMDTNGWIPIVDAKT